MPPLTAKQERVLRFVHEFAVERGWAASLTEIKEALDLPNVNSARNYLLALMFKMYIEYRGSRQIRVLVLP